MLRQSVLQVASVIILVGFFLLYLFSTVLRTILLDIVPYALSKEDVAVTRSQTLNNGATGIPKAIHQVYLGFDNKVMPFTWETARQSCIDLHPSYEYKVSRLKVHSYAIAHVNNF